MKIDFIRMRNHALDIISYPFQGLHPTVLTALGLFSSFLFFIFLINHMYLLACIAFSGSLFDAVDGYVARKTGKVSRFGGFIDAVFDRISDFFFIAAFGYAGIVTLEITLLALFTTMLVSYLRARAEASLIGSKLTEGMFQRSGRICLIGCSFILFLYFPGMYILEANIVEAAFIFLVFLNGITIIQRIIIAYKKFSH